MSEAATFPFEGPLSAEVLRKIDAYWRATPNLCVGTIYLRDNARLREFPKIEQVESRLLGRWCCNHGRTFTWVRLNRLIKKHDLNMVFVSGPGHGAAAVHSHTYLEGTYSEIYPDKSESEDGLRRFYVMRVFQSRSSPLASYLEGKSYEPQNGGSQPKSVRCRAV